MSRLTKHPIITIEDREEVSFTYNGKPLRGYKGEPIAAALHANGITMLRHSEEKGRNRGLFCAIGNCSSCLMTVNGEPNVRVCTEKLEEGMIVETQQGKGDLR